MRPDIGRQSKGEDRSIKAVVGALCLPVTLPLVFDQLLRGHLFHELAWDVTGEVADRTLEA